MFGTAARFFLTSSSGSYSMSTTGSAPSGALAGYIQGYFDGMTTYDDEIYNPYTLPAGTVMTPTTFNGILIRGVMWTGTNHSGEVTVDRAEYIHIVLDGNHPINTITSLYINKDGVEFTAVNPHFGMIHFYDNLNDRTVWKWDMNGYTEPEVPDFFIWNISIVEPTSVIVEIT